MIIYDVLNDYTLEQNINETINGAVYNKIDISYFGIMAKAWHHKASDELHYVSTECNDIDFNGVNISNFSYHFDKSEAETDNHKLMVIF